MNSWELRLLALTLLATASFGCGQSSVQQATSQTKADLPEISAFVTKPSDRFLVDVKELEGLSATLSLVVRIIPVAA